MDVYIAEFGQKKKQQQNLGVDVSGKWLMINVCNRFRL